MARNRFFRKLRIMFLLFVLFVVAVDAWLTKQRTTDWDSPLRIVVYPINADSTEISRQYVSNLTVHTFVPVERYFSEEAAEYGVSLKDPVTIKLGPVISNIPPKPPDDRNIIKVMWWSLKLRWWVFRVDDYDGPPVNVRMFLLYHDPGSTQRLAHSLGLEKGLIGVVNAFADDQYAAQNNVVIAHEFLHTLGATDKYDLKTGQPLYPAGFVDVEKKPLYPQEFAEIMAGVIPVSPTQSKMPEKLIDTLIGYQSALEINWVNE
ncbi:MAG: hypothetical protein GXP08_14430 [Gammaproteobacteria bacterium]|nr:hypothetical protein [Gammaproteobacteria bacterium]